MNFLSATGVMMYFPLRKKMITSSMSEQLATNSFFFSDVPMNPSSRSMYSFSLASATLVASMLSKLRRAVRRGKFFPYFSSSVLNQPTVYSTMFSRWRSISSISSFIRAICSLALSELNFRMRPILISMSFRISSLVTSRTNSG